MIGIVYNKVKYLIRCIIHMDYKSLFDTVGKVHKITKKNRIGLFFDVVNCGIKYGAGYKDYLLCEFFNLNKAQRETYVTRGINNTISKLMNQKGYYDIFYNKHILYDRFKKFINRDWLYVPKGTKEDFVNFMEKKDVVIIKPSDATCGVGVDKLYKKDFKDISEMYDYVMKQDNSIVEDVIEQNEFINQINGNSVNTLRIVTIFSEGESHIIYAFIRIGNSDRPVDNINAGGMCAPINIETGVIEHVGYDKDRITYEKHPKTGFPIKGTKIPLWEECKQMALDCAKVIPEMGYLGWDVAVTPTGPVLVEGNEFPGHDILQMPPHVPDKIGMLPQFKKYVKGL